MQRRWAEDGSPRRSLRVGADLQVGDEDGCVFPEGPLSCCEA